ncbi:uncharacterized protein FRV6_08556 [Fusarium oxysporum]|uniref:Uncharacterized protein n=1 Tax=Fusarium oxysporum TaxID=5507 RepID=A0A2H3TRD6_FUSOX|nr:uncharacterized protein FRV6_08556 [Fusarium oxysporum]
MSGVIGYRAEYNACCSSLSSSHAPHISPGPLLLENGATTISSATLTSRRSFSDLSQSRTSYRRTGITATASTDDSTATGLFIITGNNAIVEASATVSGSDMAVNVGVSTGTFTAAGCEITVCRKGHEFILWPVAWHLLYIGCALGCVAASTTSKPLGSGRMLDHGFTELSAIRSIC